MFNYIVQTAYTREDAAGSSAPRAGDNEPSFAYMNHDFSTCDVVSILLSIPFFNLTSQQSLPTADVS